MNIVQGDRPDLSDGTLEVMLDEGSMALLGWSLGESHSIMLNGAEQEVVIVGVTRGELARTMYFMRADLAGVMGINATSVYLQLPDGIEVDPTLAEISIGVVERKTSLTV